MNKPIILIVCAAIVSVAILMAFRWQIVVNASLIYRLDRLTGDVRVCIKQTPDDPHLLTCYKQGEPTRVSLN